MIELKREAEWLSGELGDDANGLACGDLLRLHWKLPKKTVHLLFQEGGILLDGKTPNQRTIVSAGQRLSLRLCKPEDPGITPVAAKLDVLYEDDHLLVVNKPAGLLLHPTQSGDIYTLDHLIAGYFHRQGIASKVRHVHRLDQETSGAVMYAKHALASALLDEALRQRKIKRIYTAFVHGTLSRPAGVIDQPIGKDRHHPSRRRVSPQGEPAVTHYRLVAQYRRAAQITCELETGRTNQIRVHLSHIGHPLLGDTLYGGKATGIARQALHGGELRFMHPFGGKHIRIEAGWPEDLLALKESLRT